MKYPDGTKRIDAIDTIVTDKKLKEVVLKQFNYMRLQGENLVKDADDLVNEYLEICKEIPE